jgi:Flp pilus assembly protein TadG
LRRSAAKLSKDCRGVAATEFVMIVPLMLVMFFGVVEISSGVAVDRKVTLVARTLSDLTSQSTSVADTDLQNFFAASASVLTPYTVVPVQPTLSLIYVNSSNVAKVQWSTSATVAMVSGAPKATLTTSSRKQADTVSIPPTLQVPNTYLIWSEVNYTYLPTIGYVMSKTNGVALNDMTYTRPRQSTCVMYKTTVCTTY